MKYKSLIISTLFSVSLFAQSKNEVKNCVFFSIASNNSFGKSFSRNFEIDNKITKKIGISLGLGYERTFYNDWAVRIQGNYSKVHFEQSQKTALFFDVNVVQSYQFLELPLTLITPISKNKRSYVGIGSGISAAAKYQILFKIANANEQSQIDSMGTFRKERIVVPMFHFLAGHTIPLNSKASLRFEPFCTMRFGKKLTVFSTLGTQVSYGISMILGFDVRRKEKIVTR